MEAQEETAASDSSLDTDSIRAGYSKRVGLYTAFTQLAMSTIDGILRNEDVKISSVTSRTKSLDSILEKVQRKGYSDPWSEIHDFAGVRVVLYLASDIPKVRKAIESAFRVHPDKSPDKLEELGVDRMGYRSVHVVVDIGPSREGLPEYAKYKGLLIEVQIRTVLEHAWAVIEHDLNYKPNSTLPKELKRELNRLSAALELIDNVFSTFAEKVKSYSDSVADAASKGRLSSGGRIGVDAASVSGYLRGLQVILQHDNPRSLEAGIRLFRSFGIDDINILDARIGQAIRRIKNYFAYIPGGTIHLARIALMVANPVDYFVKVLEGVDQPDLLSIMFASRIIGFNALLEALPAVPQSDEVKLKILRSQELREMSHLRRTDPRATDTSAKGVDMGSESSTG